MNGAAAVAEILKREGVEFLIAYPVNSVIEAAARADIRTIIVRQERTGIHMADAFSRLNSGRKIGVFAMQVGPGGRSAGMPGGGKPAKFRGSEGGLRRLLFLRGAGRQPREEN